MTNGAVTLPDSVTAPVVVTANRPPLLTGPAMVSGAAPLARLKSLAVKNVPSVPTVFAPFRLRLAAVPVKVAALTAPPEPDDTPPVTLSVTVLPVIVLKIPRSPLMFSVTSGGSTAPLTTRLRPSVRLKPPCAVNAPRLLTWFPPLPRLTEVAAPVSDPTAIVPFGSVTAPRALIVSVPGVTMLAAVAGVVPVEPPVNVKLVAVAVPIASAPEVSVIGPPAEIVPAITSGDVPTFKLMAPGAVAPSSVPNLLTWSSRMDDPAARLTVVPLRLPPACSVMEPAAFTVICDAPTPPAKLIPPAVVVRFRLVPLSTGPVTLSARPLVSAKPNLLVNGPRLPIRLLPVRVVTKLDPVNDPAMIAPSVSVTNPAMVARFTVPGVVSVAAPAVDPMAMELPRKLTGPPAEIWPWSVSGPPPSSVRAPASVDGPRVGMIADVKDSEPPVAVSRGTLRFELPAMAPLLTRLSVPTFGRLQPPTMLMLAVVALPTCSVAAVTDAGVAPVDAVKLNPAPAVVGARKTVPPAAARLLPDPNAMTSLDNDRLGVGPCAVTAPVTVRLPPAPSTSLKFPALVNVPSWTTRLAMSSCTEPADPCSVVAFSTAPGASLIAPVAVSVTTLPAETGAPRTMSPVTVSVALPADAKVAARLRPSVSVRSPGVLKLKLAIWLPVDVNVTGPAPLLPFKVVAVMAPPDWVMAAPPLSVTVGAVRLPARTMVLAVPRVLSLISAPSVSAPLTVRATPSLIDRPFAVAMGPSVAIWLAPGKARLSAVTFRVPVEMLPPGSVMSPLAASVTVGAVTAPARATLPVTVSSSAPPAATGPLTVTDWPSVTEAAPVVVMAPNAAIVLAPVRPRLAAAAVRFATDRLPPAASVTAPALCRVSVPTLPRLNAPPMVMAPAVALPTCSVLAVMAVDVPGGTKLVRLKADPAVDGVRTTVPPAAVRLPPGCSAMLLLASASVGAACTAPVTLSALPSTRLKLKPPALNAARAATALAAAFSVAPLLAPVSVLAARLPPAPSTTLPAAVSVTVLPLTPLLIASAPPVASVTLPAAATAPVSVNGVPVANEKSPPVVLNPASVPTAFPAPPNTAEAADPVSVAGPPMPRMAPLPLVAMAPVALSVISGEPIVLAIEIPPATSSRNEAPAVIGLATVRLCASLICVAPAVWMLPMAPMRFVPVSDRLAELSLSAATVRLPAAVSLTAPALTRFSVLTADRLNAPSTVIAPAVALPTCSVLAVTADVVPAGTKLVRLNAAPAVDGARRTAPFTADRLPPACSATPLLASDRVGAAPPASTAPVTFSALPSTRLKSPVLVKAPRLVTALPAAVSVAPPVAPVRVVAVMLPPGCVTAPVETRFTVGAVKVPFSVSAPVAFSATCTVSVNAPVWLSAWPSTRLNPPTLL